MITPMKRHPNFKGGKVKASNGYILVFVGVKHHLSDVRGYVYEHRLVAETKYGRRLRKGEQVHHIDGDKTNNAPENLQIVSSMRHHLLEHRKAESKAKHPDQTNDFIKCACGCGTEFLQFDKSNRPRKFVKGHNSSRGKDGKYY